MLDPVYTAKLSEALQAEVDKAKGTKGSIHEKGPAYGSAKIGLEALKNILEFSPPAAAGLRNPAAKSYIGGQFRNLSDSLLSLELQGFNRDIDAQPGKSWVQSLQQAGKLDQIISESTGIWSDLRKELGEQVEAINANLQLDIGASSNAARR